MLNKVRSATSVSSIVVRVLVSTVAVTAVLLLVLLAAASANTEFFDRYYQWLYAANLVVAMIFLLVVTTLVVIIIARLRKGKFGTRLLAKLAFFMALVGVVPGGIIYVVSYQFVSRSIESWFDVNVETALTSGLNLGRGMLDASLSDLQTKARLMSEQLASADAAGTTLTLLRLRDQFGVQDATIVEPTRSMSGATPDMHVVAQASGNFATLVPSDLPTQLMIDQARGRGYAAIEGEVIKVEPIDGDRTRRLLGAGSGFFFLICCICAASNRSCSKRAARTPSNRRFAPACSNKARWTRSIKPVSARACRPKARCITGSNSRSKVSAAALR